MSKELLEEINNFSSLPLKKRISLTKESIKKELKANDYHMPKNININTQYLLEIIEQAERVQELEEWRNEVTNHVVKRNDEYAKCREQNKRYREALEFYANEENYFFDEKKYKVGLGVPESEITLDYGNKARKALKGE